MNLKSQKNNVIINDGTMFLFSEKLKQDTSKNHKKNIKIDNLFKYLDKKDIQELKEIYKML